MIIYKVTYELNGEEKTETFEGNNPGHAFAKCTKKYHGCKLIRAFRESSIPGLRSKFWLEYDPPSQIAAPRMECERREQTQFGFMQ